MSDSVPLRKSLGLTSAIMITVGSVIGSGIFYKPVDVAQSMPGPWSIYALWISLGLVCLCGALAYAELGAMMPGAGGQYTFLREAWGQPIAFLFAWCYFLVINTGTMSALGVAFTMGVESLLAVKLGKPAALGCTAGMILLLAAVNSVGVRWGALLQNVTTFAKIGSLLMIVVGALLSSAPETVTSAPAPAFALSYRSAPPS